MSFTVETAPEVLDAVHSLSPALQDFFSQVVSILEETPYRFHELIQRAIDGQGDVFYQYYDGVIPLVFIYRVYPPQDEWSPGQPGLVWIRKAQPPLW